MNRFLLCSAAVCLASIWAHALTLRTSPGAELDAADEVKAEQENLHKDVEKDIVVRKAEVVGGKVTRSMTAWKSSAARMEEKRAAKDDEELDMADWAWNASKANATKLAKVDAATVEVEAYQENVHKEAQSDHKIIRLENTSMAISHASTKWTNTTYGKEQYDGELGAQDWAWVADQKSNETPAPVKKAPLPKNTTKPKVLTAEEKDIQSMAEEASKDGSSPAYLSEHDASSEVNEYRANLHKAAETDTDVKTTEKKNVRVTHSMTSWKGSRQRIQKPAGDEELDMDDWASPDASKANASAALEKVDAEKEHAADESTKDYQANLHQEAEKDHAVQNFANVTESSVKTLTKWKNSTIGTENYPGEVKATDWAWGGKSEESSK